jgi:hypothetical protein
MVFGDAFSDRKGSTAFPFRVTIDLMKAVIWNTEPLVLFWSFPKIEPHLYISLAFVY